jgi:hypothetical protein
MSIATLQGGTHFAERSLLLQTVFTQGRMDSEEAIQQHRFLTRLTIIKLAIQILDREADLTADQRGLLRTAIEAADGLAADLLERELRQGVAGGDQRRTFSQRRAMALRERSEGRAGLDEDRRQTG